MNVFVTNSTNESMPPRTNVNVNNPTKITKAFLQTSRTVLAEHSALVGHFNNGAASAAFLTCFRNQTSNQNFLKPSSVWILFVSLVVLSLFVHRRSSFIEAAFKDDHFLGFLESNNLPFPIIVVVIEAVPYRSTNLLLLFLLLLLLLLILLLLLMGALVVHARVIICVLD